MATVNITPDSSIKEVRQAIAELEFEMAIVEIEEHWSDYIEINNRYVHRDCTVINKETGELEIDHIKLTGGEA